ncbi:MAG: histidine phosphatase family protein [Arachnia sp.]
MLLHLLRHGQSTWNLENRLQGQTMEVPLTEAGRKQAAGAAAHLSTRRLSAVWSSDQLRASHTADIVAAPHGLAVTLTAQLREQSLGELEGRLLRDLDGMWAPGGRIPHVVPTGGESLRDVHQRMVLLCDSLRACFGDTDEVALVSHGDTLRVLFSVLAGRTHDNINWVAVENCKVVSRTLHHSSNRDC